MRPPLPIIAWCAFLALRAIATLVMFAGTMPYQSATAASVATLMATIVISALAIVGVWLMRRWAALLMIAIMAAQTLSVPIGVWWTRYPHTGPWVSVAWVVLFAGTCAFYWKTMSWNFFGPSGSTGEGKRYA
jgi:hypothetical protein